LALGRNIKKEPNHEKSNSLRPQQYVFSMVLENMPEAGKNIPVVFLRVHFFNRTGA
jgi:hypothetical protein